MCMEVFMVWNFHCTAGKQDFCNSTVVDQLLQFFHHFCNWKIDWLMDSINNYKNYIADVITSFCRETLQPNHSRLSTHNLPSLQQKHSIYTYTYNTPGCSYGFIVSYIHCMKAIIIFTAQRNAYLNKCGLGPDTQLASLANWQIFFVDWFFTIALVTADSVKFIHRKTFCTCCIWLDVCTSVILSWMSYWSVLQLHMMSLHHTQKNFGEEKTSILGE